MRRMSAMLTGVATLALATGVAAISPAVADPIPAAASYADLLEPVPDAMTRIAVDDARQQTARLQLAQLVVGVGVGGPGYHHHHHHSHDWYVSNGYYWNNGGWVMRPRHHHHVVRRDRSWYISNGYSWNGGSWVIAPRDHHHHHHHHHHFF